VSQIAVRVRELRPLVVGDAAVIAPLMPIGDRYVMLKDAGHARLRVGMRSDPTGDEVVDLQRRLVGFEVFLGCPEMNTVQRKPRVRGMAMAANFVDLEAVTRGQKFH
jgi:hypothetical protein